MNSADAMTPKKVISKVAVIQKHLNQLKLLSQKVNQGSVKIYADPKEILLIKLVGEQIPRLVRSLAMIGSQRLKLLFKNLDRWAKPKK